MQVSILKTADGSHSLVAKNDQGKEQAYHSHRGALQESQHVFIEAGLLACHASKVKLLEVGFGTGLNAFLSFLEAKAKGLQIEYHAVEPYPISIGLAKSLNYPVLLLEAQETFLALHRAFARGMPSTIHAGFHLYPYKAELQNLALPEKSFDLVYYDAFSPDFQPELWEASIFHGLYRGMKEGGILVTYCAQAAMRRAMKAAGFQLERLPGAPGKREMVRARKPKA